MAFFKKLFRRAEKPNNEIFKENYPVKNPKETAQEIRKAKRKQLLDRAMSSIKAFGFIVTNPKKTLAFRREVGSYAQRKKTLLAMKKKLKKAVLRLGITPLAILARTKRAYSIYAKAASKGIAANNIFGEALGLRVIVRTEKECYQIMDYLKGAPGSTIYKEHDFIKKPRAGTYRALHIITDAFGEPAEIQIRTLAMQKETEMADSMLGEYKGKGKESRRELAKSVDVLYEAFKKNPSAKVPLFLQWVELSKINLDYAKFTAGVMRRAGILTKNEAKRISWNLSRKAN